MNISKLFNYARSDKGQNRTLLSTISFYCMMITLHVEVGHLEEWSKFIQMLRKECDKYWFGLRRKLYDGQLASYAAFHSKINSDYFFNGLHKKKDKKITMEYLRLAFRQRDFVGQCQNYVCICFDVLLLVLCCMRWCVSERY